MKKIILLSLIAFSFVFILSNCGDAEKKPNPKTENNEGNGNGGINNTACRLLTYSYLTSDGEDSGSYSYEYDAQKRVIKATADSFLITYIYGANDRVDGLTATITEGGETYNITVSYEYDAAGNVTKESITGIDEDSEIKYYYKAGVLDYSIEGYTNEDSSLIEATTKYLVEDGYIVRTENTQPQETGPDYIYNIEYSYDSKKALPNILLEGFDPIATMPNNVVREKVYSGSKGSLNITTTHYTYEYNSKNFPTKKTDSDEYVETFTYECD